MQNPTDDVVRALMAHVQFDVVERAIAYQPTKVPAATWEQIRPFFVDVLCALNPPSVLAFYRETRAMMPYLVWAYESGHELAIETVFHPEMIETWAEVAHGQVRAGTTPLTKSSVTDYASILRRLARRANPAGPWQAKPGRVKSGVSKALRPPYTDIEIALMERAIDELPHGEQQRLARAILLMGLGFGPTVAELQDITAAHFRQEADGLWVDIPGTNTRSVPVLEPWATRLQEFAAECGTGTLVVKLTGRNAFANRSRAIEFGQRIPPISAQRMRTTWSVRLLRLGVDPRHLRDWSGLTSLSNMSDLITFMPEQPHKSAVAAARGSLRGES